MSRDEDRRNVRVVNAKEITVAFEEIEAHGDEGVNALLRRGCGLDGLPGRLAQRLQILPQHPEINLPLGLKIEVQRAFGDGARLGYIVHGGAIVTMTGEDFARGFQNSRAAKF